MSWKPDLSTREEVSGFVSDLLATLPDQLGIDEVIAGCEVLVIPVGAPPKYLNVALGGDAGPPQTGYTQAVLYRGGITGLAVGDYVTVIHLREGNRYEVMGPGGTAGAVVDPAPVDAEYVTMALDGTLTDERMLTAGEWLALTDGGAGDLATLDFRPDNPVVVTAAGVVTEHATIQAAITAAVACETVLIPPGTYAEDITLKNGVCVKGFGSRGKILITGDENIVTTAVNSWLENVTIIATDPPAGGMRQAVNFSHAAGTCYFYDIIISVASTANAQVIHAIRSTGAGSGLLIIDEITIGVSATQAGSNATGIRVDDYYELEMKNFNIIATCSGGGVGDDAYGIVQIANATIKATEGWLNVIATGAGIATDLFGTITYSEIVDTSDDTLFGQNVWLLDGNAIGIDGNERLTFNAAGNATFIGVTSVIVPNGAWVGADANASWMFDTTNSDVTTLDKVGVGTRAPGNLVHVYSATSAILEIEGFADNAYLLLNSATDAGAGEDSAIIFQHNSVSRFWLYSAGTAAAATLYIYDVARAAASLSLIGNGDMTLMGGGGDVGVGVAPTYKLDILADHSGGFAAYFFNDGDNVDRHGIAIRWGKDDQSATSNYPILCYDGAGGIQGGLVNINEVMQIFDPSDEILKDRVENLTGGLEKILALRPVEFNWKKNLKGPRIRGFVAQEMREVQSDFTCELPDGTLASIPGQLIPWLVIAIQEQETRIKQLQKQYEKGRTK